MCKEPRQILLTPSTSDIHIDILHPDGSHDIEWFCEDKLVMFTEKTGIIVNTDRKVPRITFDTSHELITVPHGAMPLYRNVDYETFALPIGPTFEVATFGFINTRAIFRVVR